MVWSRCKPAELRGYMAKMEINVEIEGGHCQNSRDIHESWTWVSGMGDVDARIQC